MAFNPSNLITSFYVTKLRIYFVTSLVCFLLSRFISDFIAEIQGQRSPYSLAETQAQSRNKGAHVNSTLLQAMTSLYQTLSWMQ